MAAKGAKVQQQQPVVMPSLKLRDMDEKNMHNLFLKNMAGLIEEIKNPSPCLNPWVKTKLKSNSLKQDKRKHNLAGLTKQYKQKLKNSNIKFV